MKYLSELKDWDSPNEFFFMMVKKYDICGIVFAVSIFVAMNVKHNK